MKILSLILSCEINLCYFFERYLLYFLYKWLEILEFVEYELYLIVLIMIKNLNGLLKFF